MNKHHLLGVLALAAVPAFAAEQVPATDLSAVEVTATRIPEPVNRVPASVTVITGDELRARGATDLRTALSLVAGVEAPPGGDAGPASAVPSLWGLHEFDAFLLVVDGIPWGGAFNPSIPTLDLNDVEKIEVLRGAAPAVYGATAFVGVIQVIHYPAGSASGRAELGYGSYGTVTGSASRALPALGGWQHSLALSTQRRQLSDGREQINNGKLLYRGATELGGGRLRFDSDITLQHTVPNSPVARQGDALVTPVDANFNPGDARVDEHKYHFVLGYTRDTFLGRWETTASYAHSNIGDIRGFIRADNLTSDPGDRGNNADYQNQDRGIIDSYFDSHFSKELGEGMDLVYGADLLYGSGKQQSVNGAYCAGGAGDPYFCPAGQDQQPPLATALLPVDEINGIDDRRAFFGQYAMLDWKPDQRLDFNAGLRVSETRERKTSSHVDTMDPTADTLDYDSSSKTRLSGSLGASYLAWSSGADEAVVYADYRNTFKPAAIDFGPDVTPAVLSPETARSYEAGFKGHLCDGRLQYDTSLFFLHMNNLVVPTAAGPLANAGSSMFKGVELETRYRLVHDLNLAFNYSFHEARFINRVTSDGDFSGRRQDLSPYSLASAGVLYTPRQGLYGSFIASYVGRRYLDPGNEASTGSYTLLDAGLGYRWYRVFAAVNGYNLGDSRKPVTNSEFGAESFYLLPARTVLFSIGIDL